MHTDTAAPARATRTSPDFIAPDTYAGRWTRVGRAQGQRTDLFTAQELGDMLGADGQPFTFWEASGQVREGKPLFVRSRFMRNADGSLSGYDSAGRLVIVHPAQRVIGVLTH